MIQVCDFSKQYKSSFKISGISFAVEPGKITALVGANGSGKSTIIKAICGFHYADGGEILISGSTSYVPEISNLPQEMYTIDFLEYAARTHFVKDSEVQKSIRDVVRTFSLTEGLNKKIKSLSKGFQQRVSLAQAMIFNPQNIVLDEPISGLDPLQIVELRKLLKKLSKTKSILFSTHIMQEVQELCDNIVLLKDGKQIAYGPEKEILLSAGVKSLEELI